MDTSAGECEVIKPSGGAWTSGPALLGGLFLVAMFTTYRSSEDLAITLGVATAGAR